MKPSSAADHTSCSIRSAQSIAPIISPTQSCDARPSKRVIQKHLIDNQRRIRARAQIASTPPALHPKQNSPSDYSDAPRPSLESSPMCLLQRMQIDRPSCCRAGHRAADTHAASHHPAAQYSRTADSLAEQSVPHRPDRTAAGRESYKPRWCLSSGKPVYRNIRARIAVIAAHRLARNRLPSGSAAYCIAAASESGASRAVRVILKPAHRRVRHGQVQTARAGALSRLDCGGKLILSQLPI